MYYFVNNTWPLTFLSCYRNFNKKWRGNTNLKTQISLLKTYKIIHDRSLSYLGTETSITSEEVKLNLRLKSPLTDIKNNTWPLTFLSWHRNFNKKWRGKTRLKTQISLLKTYKIIHDRSLSYLATETSSERSCIILYVFMREIWLLSLVLPRHFLLKFLCQDRKVSSHVLFCMSLRGRFES
jgi:hypothetical protein